MLFVGARLPQNFYPEELEGDKLGDFWGTKEKSDISDSKVRRVPTPKNWIPLSLKFDVYQNPAAPLN